MNLLKTLILGLLLTLSTFSFSENKTESVQVKFITSAGDFVVQLYPKKAPKTVANFLSYVDKGFYSGTIFHRVIKGFMVQGGGFNQDFIKKTANKPIRNESNNGLKNIQGSISMARTNNIHSATAQFFINTKNNHQLDYRGGRHGYAVFGKVIKGYEVVSQIENEPTGRYSHYRDVPKNQVIIKQVVRL